MTGPSPASRKLFGGLIDYAGMFPPARLDPAEALGRYRRAASGRYGWMLGPFLVGAGRLSRLPPGSAAFPLAVVLDGPGGRIAGPRGIRWTETLVDPGAVGEQVRWAAERSPVVYAESREPTDLAHLEELAALRSGGLDARAKIRTGGASPRSFPPVERMARFIEAALAREVPFKATAGLHHPIRRPSEVRGATEHGFVNLLAAVRAGLAGDAAAVRSALAETDHRRFDLPTAVWRGVGEDLAPQAVRRAFRSFGSCSFHEPAGRLARLGGLAPRSDR